jgi:uncharacterized protein YqjF (DUF2071 family)
MAANGSTPRLNTMRQPQIEDRLLARQRPESQSVLRMRWEQLLFLHWAWDAEQIQKTLPQGLFVDTFDGKGWLAIVPFFMKRVHPRGLPYVPWLSDFLELNVRTYVYNRAGRPGVWFYSLLCNQLLAVQLARRCFHLNYVHTRMNALVDQGGMCSYSARLRGGRAAQYRFGATKGKAEAQPGSLEFFLVERYILFSADRHNRLHSGRVHHPPYRVGPGSVERWSFDPAAADGFRNPGRPADHVLVAENLEVEAWPIVMDAGS